MEKQNWEIWLVYDYIFISVLLFKRNTLRFGLILLAASTVIWVSLQSYILKDSYVNFRNSIIYKMNYFINNNVLFILLRRLQLCKQAQGVFLFLAYLSMGDTNFTALYADCNIQLQLCRFQKSNLLRKETICSKLHSCQECRV